MLRTHGGRYIEPFLGAGHVYFRVGAKTTIAGDANPSLVGAYKSLVEDHSAVASQLAKHRESHSRDYYYEVRQRFNSCREAAEGTSCPWRAASFIYLNRASFNGIWRVNAKGEFNTPIGDESRIWWPSDEDLAAVAAALEDCTLIAADFEETIVHAQRGDVVYLDPPYSSLPERPGFTKYTANSFHQLDTERVFEAVDSLRLKGCAVVLSELDTPLVRERFEHYEILTLSNTHWVKAKGSPERVSEVLIIGEP